MTNQPRISPPSRLRDPFWLKVVSSVQVFPFCGMLSVTSRLLGDMVSISAEFAAGAGPWVGPSVDPENSRVAGWAPDDILELQKFDDIAALKGCSLSFVHGSWSAGFQG